MSAEDRCCFCQRLTPLSGRRGSAGVPVRCPVCQGRLVRTADKTYRDDGCPPAGERSSSHFRLAAAATLCGLVAVVAAGAALTAVTRPTRPVFTQPTGPPVAWAEEAKVATLRRAGEEARPTPETPAPHTVQPPAAAPVMPATTPHPPQAAEKAVAAASPPAAAVSTPPRGSDPDQTDPVARARAAPPPWESVGTSEDLAEVLRKVPELSLIRTGTEGGAAHAGAPRQAAWREVEQSARKHRDKFLDHLLADRPDLAGLPIRKGRECQLNGAAAQALHESSREVRSFLATALGAANPARRPGSESTGPAAATTFQVFHELVRNPRLGSPRALPTVEQILTGESPAVRLALVQFLGSPRDAAAVAVLARRAVFDPSADVRQAALAALHSRRPADYLPTFLSGLRHPWPPANRHAAEALVALGAEAAAWDLVRLLDAPDPAAPFEMDEGGQKVTAVRELVRVNHHGGCLLCHAPSFAADDLARGPVPNPQSPLPPLSAYYGSGRPTAGGLFVRADVTYLRQDFSEVLPVENPGPWPKQQRFDFLVRVRRLTDDEVKAWRGRDRDDSQSPGPPSRQATLFALKRLTGLDAGFAAASWEEALASRPRPTGPK
jgi:HEAT repeats